MAKPFTIRIYAPEGDPEGVLIIDRMNWTGLGVRFPRERWPDLKKRPEFRKTGIYVLFGYSGGDNDLPTLYIGQGDCVGDRIDSHFQNKDFWSWGITFVSTNDGLNRAHITWLEYALVRRALDAKRCRLDNGNTPQEPSLSEAEKADTRGFLDEILQILPLVNLRVFEHPKPIGGITKPEPAAVPSENDTIIVPAQQEGFEQVFLGEHCWHEIRISGGMLGKIKYIAGYQTAPISAITHVAPVKHIEPYGNEGKYKVVFSEPAKPIGPIKRGDLGSGVLQGPTYTNFAKLQTAKTIAQLFGKKP